MVLAFVNIALARLTKINSCEYKILLKPEKFQDRAAAFRAIWDTVKIFAHELGIEVVEANDPFKEYRQEVIFYDTDSFDLRKRNYILRMRRKYDGDKPRGDYELTLKYCSNVLEESQKADVTPAFGYRTKSKFEEAILIAKDSLGSIRSIYSKSAKVKKIDYKLSGKLEDFARFFPVLSKLGLPSDAVLKPVNGVIIDERKSSPGMLKFGDNINGMVDITVWYLKGDTTHPLVAEFSYDCKIRDYDNMSKDAAEKCNEFFKKLQLRMADWVYLGATKTDTVFKYKKEKNDVLGSEKDQST